MQKILIVGGGTAGWMTAALFGKLFQGRYDIELIESEAIGTVGVGEATIPPIKTYNELLQLDEAEFMRRTQGDVQARDRVRRLAGRGPSLHARLRSHRPGLGVAALPPILAAARTSGEPRATSPNIRSTALPRSPASSFTLAPTWPSRRSATSPTHSSSTPLSTPNTCVLWPRSTAFGAPKGASSTSGTAESGDIESVTLDDGRAVAADFFIDCSGFRGLLIEQTLKTGYEDWSHWLPCDRAIAVPCARTDPVLPYTRATARDSGWQWRIPLQHRTGNGLVYSSRHIDDDAAEKLLLANLDAEQLANPNRLRFTSGKRRKMWNRNCVALGLAAGFLEPLELTSIHLVQSAAIRLVRLFPNAATDQATIDEFNRKCDFEWERIRDFIVLHYWANRRQGEFWDFCRSMELPVTLQRKIDLWRSNGRIFREDDELFTEESWIQVLIGQGIMPRSHDPLTAIKSDAQIDQFLGNIAATIGRCVDVMPAHDDYLRKYCPAVALA